MIIGCDLHTRYQQIAMLDTDTGELTERGLEHESGEARLFTPRSRVGAGRDGSHWAHALVRGHAGGVGSRTVDGGCGQDSGGGGAQAEDGCAGCGASVGAAAQPALSEDLAAVGAERDLRQLVWHRQKLVWMRGAVKNQMHALAMGEGVCRKKKLFTAKGRAGTGGAGAGAVGELSAARVAADVRRTAGRGGATGPGGGASCEESGAGGTFDDTSRSGAGHVAGFRADHRTGGAIRTQQASGELSGTESAGSTVQRGKAAAGIDQQARQSDDAFAAGGSRSHRRRVSIRNCGECISD